LKKIIRYGLFIFVFAGIFSSCKKQKKLDTRVSLWRLDKIPYGTKYAYDNLNFIFPGARIKTGNKLPVLYNDDDGDTMRTLIIIGQEFYAGPEEMNSIIRFAASGNQVFISALYFEDTVMSMLKLAVREDGNFLNTVHRQDSGRMSLMDPSQNAWIDYAYPGFASNDYFDIGDSVHTAVLGKNVSGKPDFVRIPYAHGGSIFIHLNPFAFSNFFLLHGANKTYYDIAFSDMSKKTDLVEWSDYFRYRRGRSDFSALRFILSSRALKWAFWLTVLLFLILFGIESKRKQRSITQMPVLRNASEDFVKTVGRLYFQQKNNQNLAAKMVTAFLENVRSNYNLSTSVLNEEFAHKLAFRAGRPVNEITHMLRLIHEAQLKSDLSDQELMELHQQINQFNKPV
jgi:hypothetical protein